MTSPLAPRPTDIAACHQRIGQLEAIVAAREATIAAHEATINDLRQTLERISADNALLKRELFGSRRERFVDDEPQSPPAADPRTAETEPPPKQEPEPEPKQEQEQKGEEQEQQQQQERKKKRTSSGRRRRKFPECLPREQRWIHLRPEEIPAEMRDNPRARRFFKKIGEILEVIPMQLKVVEQYQEVIMLDRDDEQSAAVAASRPARLIKSFASPSLLAYLTVSRFADHLPYYRLEDITGRSGYRIERSTQWRWMRELAKGVARLTDLMWDRIRQSAVLNVDETYVRELCGQGRTLTGYLWAGVGDARHPYDCFVYTSGRSCAGPETFLKGFQGYLVADAYVAYERIGELWPEVSKATCWIHARRGFEACHKLGPTPHTRRAMNFFQRLFDIEDRYRTADSATRHAARQEQSKPIVDEFRVWLEDVGKTRLPKDKLLGAIHYMLDRWPSFLRFLESGDIPLDNNAAERALKFPILGRKAWLFVGNAAAGHTAAKLFTLTKTCNRLHINPFAYLQDVYARLPTTTDDDLVSLLPDRWIAEHPQHLIPERVQEAHDRALRAREKRAQRRRCAA